MAASEDLYALLDVAPTATLEELREARGFKLRAFHPDRFATPADRERAEEMTKRVNAAWDVLRDPARREAYDRQRRGDGPSSDGAAGRPQEADGEGIRVRRDRREAPATLSLPCPACGTFASHLNAGDGAHLRCPTCATSFAALVGASVHHCTIDWSGSQPRLDVRYRRRDGGEGRVAFDAPADVELHQHDLFSLVYAPEGEQPATLVNHATADVVRLPGPARTAPRLPGGHALIIVALAAVALAVLIALRG
jgi:hypothetical protein